MTSTRIDEPRCRAACTLAERTRREFTRPSQSFDIAAAPCHVADTGGTQSPSLPCIETTTRSTKRPMSRAVSMHVRIFERKKARAPRAPVLEGQDRENAYVEKSAQSSVLWGVLALGLCAVGLVAMTAEAGARRRSAGRCRAPSAAPPRISALPAFASARTSSACRAVSSRSSSTSPARSYRRSSASMRSPEDRSSRAGRRRATIPASIPRWLSSPPCRSAPAVGEFLAWKWFGGGNKMRDEIYEKHGMVAKDCFCIAPGDLRLVPQGGQVGRGAEGPQDALLRARRPGDGKARRLDAAAGGRRHLSGAGARRDRCHRVLDADDGHPARLPPDRKVQLFPRLAPAGLVQPFPHEQEGVGCPAGPLQGDDRGRRAKRRFPTPTPRPRPCSST